MRGQKRVEDARRPRLSWGGSRRLTGTAVLEGALGGETRRSPDRPNMVGRGAHESFRRPCGATLRALTHPTAEEQRVPGAEADHAWLWSASFLQRWLWSASFSHCWLRSASFL